MTESLKGYHGHHNYVIFYIFSLCIEEKTLKQTDAPSITTTSLPGVSTSVTQAKEEEESDAQRRRGSEEGTDDQVDEVSGNYMMK